MAANRTGRLGIFSLCPSDKIPYFGIRKICRVHASHLGEDRIPAQSLGDEGEDDSPGLLVSIFSLMSRVLNWLPAIS